MSMNDLFCVTRDGVSKARFRPSISENVRSVARLAHGSAMLLGVFVGSTQWMSPKTDHEVDCARGVAIGDQAKYGACVAFATVGAESIKRAQRKSAEEKRSEAHLYLLMRDAMGCPNEDSGADSQHALYVLAQLGVCAESIFPYGKLFDDNGKAVRPSVDAIRDASDERIDVSAWVEINSLDALEQAIRADHPTIFGTEVDETIQAYTKDQVLSEPDFRKIIGGHEMTVVAVRYVEGVRQWGVRNSWSADYGDAGWLWVDDSFLRNPSITGSMFALVSA